MKRLSLLLGIFILSAPFAFSVDFGLYLNQKIETENDIFEYTPSLAPWFSWNGDKGMSIFLSCLFSFRYGKYNEEYFKSNDWDNYFASKRALVSLRWDIPVGKTSDIAVEALAQFDLNRAKSVLHSQYAMVQYELIRANMIRFTAGALFESMQNKAGNFKGAFGALAQIKIYLPTEVNDQLGIRARITSGFINDTWTGFTPINLIQKNMIFTGSASGLAAITLDYEIRIIKSLYAQCAFNYFMHAEKNDSSDGNMYGGELWASFVFQPFGDLRAGIGTGVFFPGMGNIYPKDSAVQWKVIASLTLSF